MDLFTTFHNADNNAPIHICDMDVVAVCAGERAGTSFIHVGSNVSFLVKGDSKDIALHFERVQIAGIQSEVDGKTDDGFRALAKSIEHCRGLISKLHARIARLEANVIFPKNMTEKDLQARLDAWVDDYKEIRSKSALADTNFSS